MMSVFVFAFAFELSNGYYIIYRNVNEAMFSYFAIFIHNLLLFSFIIIFFWPRACEELTLRAMIKDTKFHSCRFSLCCCYFTSNTMTRRTLYTAAATLCPSRLIVENDDTTQQTTTTRSSINYIELLSYNFRFASTCRYHT